MHFRRTLSALALAGALPSLVSAQALPDAKALIAKHEAAIGGRDAWGKHSSLHMSGTLSISTPGGAIEGTTNVYRTRSNKMLQQMTLGALGESLQGYDGKTAWAVQPMQGPQVLSGELAEQMKDQADFFSEFVDVAKYSTLETLALEEFEGHKCYKVRMVKTEGGEESFRYFDAETGLQAGAIRSVDSGMGKLQIVVSLFDYKDQGGVKMPTRLSQKNPQFELTMTFSAYEWDKVDDALLALPDAVKSMVKPN